MLLLHHKGAKTGTQRVSPLMYRSLNNGYAIFASKGGADDNPDCHNIKANPDTEVEVGSERVAVKARVAEGEESEAIWSRHKSEWPLFAEYEAKTTRETIPVVVLEPVG